jgi:hypothetical protein
MRSHRFRAATPLVGLIVLFAACEGAAGRDEIDTTSSAVSASPLGLVCGMGYQNKGIWVDGACLFKRTMVGEKADGFHIAFDGDYGLAAGDGFYHQSLDANEGLMRAIDAVVPRGTTCGFKHSCNSSFREKCFDKDPQVECPLGWIPRQASDAKARTGCSYFWCEYLDPQNKCLDFKCAQPNGLTCGMTDSDRLNGFCEGVRVTPGALRPCPFGFTFRGTFDDGRQAGHGLAWCEKNL